MQADQRRRLAAPDRPASHKMPYWSLKLYGNKPEAVQRSTPFIKGVLDLLARGATAGRLSTLIPSPSESPALEEPKENGSSPNTRIYVEGHRGREFQVVFETADGGSPWSLLGLAKHWNALSAFPEASQTKLLGIGAKDSADQNWHWLTAAQIFVCLGEPGLAQKAPRHFTAPDETAAPATARRTLDEVAAPWRAIVDYSRENAPEARPVHAAVAAAAPAASRPTFTDAASLRALENSSSAFRAIIDYSRENAPAASRPKFALAAPARAAPARAAPAPAQPTFTDAPPPRAPAEAPHASSPAATYSWAPARTSPARTSPPRASAEAPHASSWAGTNSWAPARTSPTRAQPPGNAPASALRSGANEESSWVHVESSAVAPGPSPRSSKSRSRKSPDAPPPVPWDRPGNSTSARLQSWQDAAPASEPEPSPWDNAPSSNAMLFNWKKD